METSAIRSQLKAQHQQLYDWISLQPDTSWEAGPSGKWTTGQQVLHLVESSRAILKGLSYPKFLLKYKFGICNREGRSYDKVVARYQERLAETKDLNIAFNANLQVPQLQDKTALIKELQVLEQKLLRKLERWNDRQLDRLLLPHPLMGKMTIRELFMWTGYHIEHHVDQLKKNYQF